MLRQETIDRIRTNRSAMLGREATEEQIEEAEGAIGVELPESYRRFLAEFGWGGIGDLEVIGTGADVPPFLDLVRLTLSERADAHPRMRRSLVPIAADGAGNYYCIRTEAWQQEGPVVLWDHEAGEDQRPEEVATNFGAWLEDRVNALMNEDTDE